MRMVPFQMAPLLALLCLGHLSLTGQDNPCTLEPTEKAAKWIEKGTNKNKYDAEKRRGFLENALDEDAECLEATFQLGLLSFAQARQSSGSFSEARQALEQVQNACPSYSADVPYTLGVIAYAEEEYNTALQCCIPLRRRR